MRQLIFGLVVVAALSAAPGKRTFTGMITDSVCANADHSCANDEKDPLLQIAAATLACAFQ